MDVYVRKEAPFFLDHFFEHLELMVEIKMHSAFQYIYKFHNIYIYIYLFRCLFPRKYGIAWPIPHC